MEITKAEKEKIVRRLVEFRLFGVPSEWLTFARALALVASMKAGVERPAKAAPRLFGPPTEYRIVFSPTTEWLTFARALALAAASMQAGFESPPKPLRSTTRTGVKTGKLFYDADFRRFWEPL